MSMIWVVFRLLAGGFNFVTKAIRGETVSILILLSVISDILAAL